MTTVERSVETEERKDLEGERQYFHLYHILCCTFLSFFSKNHAYTKIKSQIKKIMRKYYEHSLFLLKQGVTMTLVTPLPSCFVMTKKKCNKAAASMMTMTFIIKKRVSNPPGHQFLK